MDPTSFPISFQSRYNCPMATHRRIYGETRYGQDTTLLTLPLAQFDVFTPEVLGLGDIRREGRRVEALTAIFDLEGFTDFCNQSEPHLVVPDFLARYLAWIFESFKRRFRHSQTETEVRLWSSLPIFAKFMGDGLLLIWDTEQSGGLHGIHNIIFHLFGMTREYNEVFLPKIAPHFSKVPRHLRCGVARGQVLSVGDEADYVGPSINTAARLQKLPGLTFAISRRGCDLFSLGQTEFTELVMLTKVELRGVGSSESVFILSEEFAMLSEHHRLMYTNTTAAV